MNGDDLKKAGFRAKSQKASRQSSVSKSDIEEMLNAYIEAALFSTTDESDDSGGEPLDKNYSSRDLASATRSKMKKDVTAFARANATAIDGKWSQAGHDFWLNRNGHGAGFWDGDWPEPAATQLDNASKAFGTVNLYVHNKKIHQSP